MSRLKLETIKSQIDDLDGNEHIQLYEIIQRYNTVVSKTTNGVFVSSENISEKCLEDICRHIQFCLDQRARIEEDSKTRKVYEKLTNPN
jgi:hypothetical protein